MMKFEVTSQARGPEAEHRTSSAIFWSTEQRMGGSITQPNPLELLLGSLSGCMNVVLQMVAQERGLGAITAAFHVTGEIDPRGFMGDARVVPYFQRVSVTAEVAGIPQEALADVQKIVGQRCPVHRLFDQAGIPIEEQWTLNTAVTGG